MSFYVNDISPVECHTGENEISVIFYNNVPVWSKPGTAWDGWGDETAIGDASWWANLRTWVLTAAPEDRQACVGKTKKVSLSTAVWNYSVVLMRCIGADQDGVGTLTFDMAGGVDTYQQETVGAWIGSVRRAACLEFYEYCSAKDSIKVVSKGTCPTGNNSYKGTPEYNDETVFMLSIREVGLNAMAPIKLATSTTTNAECCYGYNGTYSYYNTAENRIKYVMDANGDLTSDIAVWSLRSRYYSTYSTKAICYVDSSGKAGTNQASGTLRIAPAFVIG